MTTDTTIDSLFEDAIAAWDEPVRCQTAQSARPCGNQARWLATNCHGARHGQPHTVLLCSFHKTRWLRQTWDKIACWGYFQCTPCGQRFTVPEQFVAFKPA
ncbi:hypothetical protein JF729_13575 [Mycobacterium intracellulare]|uniref:hypothetical protein n=1 Tax=Mycobacterium intracellulare TaxID=1767 RepID=UPI001CDA01EA|nr:hypothetical protein [Mycobacterium intracellulare]MCA2248811.1 hypothetical protein [Mycobacterium intracellulare]